MRTLIYTLIGAIGLFFLFTAGTDHSGGSIGGKTASPGDGGANCTQCHSGTLNTAEDWITSDIPTSGYISGETYTITATGTHTGVVKFGFEATAEDNSDAKTGTFIITNSEETKLTNSNNAVTHQSDGTTPSGDSRSWSFDWTAPETGTGDVTFYAAFNAANGNGGTSGDVIYKTSYAVTEHTVSVDEISSLENMINIYPNPVTDRFYIDAKEINITEISIFNTSGGLVLQNTSIDSESNIVMQTGNLKPGNYYVVIKTSNNREISKSIIKL
ncbi:MAG: hypothetical protein B6D61_14445 [Bacteroidetes bacterium 4484_249]|nr:MAG: hypothetical protein B6D61_14445 [Bacteroidetes bacterium 4484_249]